MAFPPPSPLSSSDMGQSPCPSEGSIHYFGVCHRSPFFQAPSFMGRFFTTETRAPPSTSSAISMATIIAGAFQHRISQLIDVVPWDCCMLHYSEILLLHRRDCISRWNPSFPCATLVCMRAVVLIEAGLSPPATLLNIPHHFFCSPAGPSSRVMSSLSRSSFQAMAMPSGITVFINYTFSENKLELVSSCY